MRNPVMRFRAMAEGPLLRYSTTMDGTVPQFWVFGYGSLMWRTGFDYVERKPGKVFGFHRSLCVFSHVHRGTPERPGLVMGLDRGGSCQGAAFRIAPEAWQPTLDYLRAREQVTMVYREVLVPVRLQGGATVPAIAYVVDRSHRQYAGRLSAQQQLELINQGLGQSGHCRDYVLSTLAHLREEGAADQKLEELARQLAHHAAMPAG